MEDDLDLIDDSYRTCEICDIVYHEDFGESCLGCDIWVCNNCWSDHIVEHLE